MNAHKFLEGVLGHEPSDSTLEQFEVFIAALKLMDERNARYEDLWKQYGATDSLLHMRSKQQRTERELSRVQSSRLAGGDEVTDVDCDDAYDLINYAAFYIRNVREGNLG